MEGNFGGNNPENSMEQKSGKPKWFKVIVGAFLALFLLISGTVVWRAISMKQGRDSIVRLAETLKQAEQKALAEQMADTYGGKTPQETLQMYILAVERGDYELASRYFVPANQEKELRSFDNAAAEDIKNYLIPLKTTLRNGKGEFSFDKKYFSFGGSVLVSMTLYPNGIWKIIEI